MNPFQNKSEYVISTWMFETFDLKKALQAIANKGFNNIELWGDTVHFDPRAGLSTDNIKFWVQQYGLNIHSAHAPFRNFFNHSLDHHNDDMEFLRYRMGLWYETINRCEELRIPILVMHAMNRREYPYTLSDVKIVKETLENLCDYAGSRGVTIALENIPDNNPVLENDISCTIKNQKTLFNLSNMKFCLDIGHVPLTGADIFNEIDAAGNKLVSFHVHNNNGLIDSHDLPNTGILNWSEIYKYAREKGYLGEFVIEVYGGKDPEKKLNEVAALFNDTQQG
ncbi:MAG: sugar phosphate isomerase/epimerase [Eubacteriales bacterium]|nr:sugar phosphate isomerase/epimerase [Eubacteriales bacterium]